MKKPAMLSFAAVALALLPFTALAADPVPQPEKEPQKALVAPPAPIPPTPENKDGFFSRLLGGNKSGVGPAPIATPNMADTSFGKVETDSGVWTINRMPGGVGSMQQCSANFLPKTTVARPDKPAEFSPQTINVNISRVRSVMPGQKEPQDILQYSVAAMLVPKDTTAALAIDGAGQGRATMQTTSISAGGEVTDLVAFRKNLAAGTKATFAAGDQKLTVAAADMLDVLKKLDSCIATKAKP